MTAEFNSDQTEMPEVAECRCADDHQDYIEAHEDEFEDLEAYARKRGLKQRVF